MPEDMPLHIQRGPLIAALERFCDDDRNLFDLRQKLRDPDINLTKAMSFAGLGSLPDAEEHLRNDWFEVSTASPPTKQAFGVANPTTGFWMQYHGDVHEIVRRTLQTAVDAALRRDELALNDPAEVWQGFELDYRPIVFLWDCTSTWFGGYVSWTAEQVTCIFHTPAPKGAVVRDDYPPTAVSTSDANGHAIVTHQEQVAVLGWYPKATVFGDISFPKVGFLGDGPVTRSSYAAGDGGVDAVPPPGDNLHWPQGGA